MEGRKTGTKGDRSAGASSRTLRRPARRVRAGKKQRGRQERKTWAVRLSRISPRVVILAILAVVFIAFAFGPTMRNLEATFRLKQKGAELKQQRSITDALEKRVKEARSLRYVEAEARRQRLVKPGEVLYLVSSKDEGDKIEYRLKSLQSMDEAWERIGQMMSPPGTRTDQRE
jgi:hypothetical protein